MYLRCKRKTMDKTMILRELDRYLSEKVAALTEDKEISSFRMAAFTLSKPVPEGAYWLIDESYRSVQKSVEGFLKALNELSVSDYGTYYVRLQELTLVYDEKGKVITGGRNLLTSYQLKRYAFMYLIQTFFEDHPDLLKTREIS